jgi:glycosyltransferase involved in cell wall biosynthesis
MAAKTLIYTASDSGFDLRQVPLGGAAPICGFLSDEWRAQSSFEFRLLSPDILGDAAPRGNDLLRYTPKQYVDFYFAFEAAITQEILRYDPHHTVVLSNDMSDGPSFPLLAERGYPVYCIYHMNMVHYFTSAFLHGLIRPETAASIYRAIDHSRFRRVLPRPLELIFLKQEQSLIYSRGIIVPSEGMKRLLVRMYPDVSANKIHVFPWGSRPDDWDETLVADRAAALRQKYAIEPGTAVLVMLSRISPEKGQDRLLKALEIWERSPDFPPEGLCVLLCGVAGYAQAEAYEKSLMKHAQRLKKSRVVFTGYVHGLEKQAHFRLGDLYVFPSRQESYGLTLMEAFRAQLPAVATFTDGTEQLVRKEFGELLPPAAERQVPRLLKEAIQRLLADRSRLKNMGRNAREFALAHPFSDTASRLARLMMS